MRARPFYKTLAPNLYRIFLQLENGNTIGLRKDVNGPCPPPDDIIFDIFNQNLDQIVLELEEIYEYSFVDYYCYSVFSYPIVWVG